MVFRSAASWAGVYNAAAGREEGSDESYSNSIKQRAALNWN